MTYSPKPSSPFSWATGITPAAPGAGLIASGYGTNAIPASSDFNSMFQQLGLWTAYLNTLDSTVLPFAETFGDIWNDVAISGAAPATSANLTTTLPTQVAYVIGQRVAPALLAVTVAASKDTYYDLSSAGVWTAVAVANGAGAPTVTANSLRMFKLVSGVAAITGVTDLRPTTLTAKPAALALPATAFSGKVSATASVAGAAGLNIAPGVAVTAPNNGDVWPVGGSLFFRLGGVTQTAEVQANKGVASGYAALNASSQILGSAGTATGQATTFDQFAPLINARGYIKTPGGVIFQWGTFANLTFPLAFPNACWQVMSGCRWDSGTTAQFNPISAWTTTGFTAYSQTVQAIPNSATNTTTLITTIPWFAVGN